MRASSFLIATLRDDPAEAQVTSHRLMLRAGLVRKQGAGLYHTMPMGLRVFRKIENAVREEMNAAGAVEFQLPILTPSDLWEKSGRWNTMGKEMFRLKDRHDVWNALGPTHEESFTELVKDLVKSYRDLPLNVYQIHTKFRDEIRPRFGVIRSREFCMKDAYSFDLNEAGLDKTYEKMRVAYRQIFARVGLRTIPVEADTGSMGGTGSEEFMIASEIGEETLLISEGGKYKSNQEKTPVVYKGGAAAAKEPSGKKAAKAGLAKVHTPNCPGIDDVARFLKVEATAILKTLIYKADDGFVAAALRGDRQINEIKLRNKSGAIELRQATPEEIATIGTMAGYIGPQGIPDNVKIFWDKSLSTGAEWVVGANEVDHHCTGYVLPAGVELLDVALAVAGDPSPAGDGVLTAVKGIEVGHIFKLGDKYTKAFDVKVLDEGGRPVVPLMGCYGIGVTRTIAAIIEQWHDAKGIAWPMTCAPFEFVLVSITRNSEEEAKVKAVYDAAVESGLEILWDDRDMRPGVKFADAELIGYPVRITAGKTFLEKGVLEVQLRRAGEQMEVGGTPGEIAAALKQIRARLAADVAEYTKE